MTNKKLKTIDAKALPQHFDIAERERFWRQRWDTLGVEKFDESVPRDQVFAIDSPPPTVSGSLHMGHIFSYTHQDLIARFQRMRGKQVLYPMGWDDNGLPTERRVQNYYNVRAEPGAEHVENLDIQKERERLDLKKSRALVISRKNFIDLCHSVTAKDEEVFKDLFQRLGLSIDWRYEYATIDHESRRTAQLSFLDLYEKNELYSEAAPTMWDVDFQTAVAQAEVEDRELTGAFHDIEFGIADGDQLTDQGFVISTTRPELIPACVGVAAHPNDERYQHLFGKTAVTPMFFAPLPIFASEHTDPEKGSGILMVSTFGDQMDVDWWREHSLPLRQMLGANGRVLDIQFDQPNDGITWQSLRPEQANINIETIVGKTVHSARQRVVEMLRDASNSAIGNGTPLQGEPKPVTRPVRYFEKGDRPLEYLISRQWFVKSLDHQSTLIDAGRDIAWHPEFMRKRYENWTNNLNADWCISRQRYFGVPLPIWYQLDDQGNRQYGQVIVATPKQMPVDPMSDVPAGFDENQRDQPNGFTGERDIFDTWFTSSMTPQRVARWQQRDELMPSVFPMNLRPQGHDIIRTWAFYTILKSVLHHQEAPWKNIMVNGMIF
ncbi:MAG: valine--tRNA ligase, partial [Gammaproteobacteria bacterium]|nr:valine--tRNA ligase [Gammaproteobacteria bacterium]